MYILDKGNNVVKVVANDQIFTFYNDQNPVNSISILDLQLYLSSSSSMLSVNVKTLQVKVVYGNYGTYYPFSTPIDALSVFLNRPSQITNFGNSIIFPTRERILKLDLSNGMLTTLAGSSKVGNDEGPALSASFYEPSAICVDSVKALIIVDTNNNKIREMRGDYSTVITRAGNGYEGFYDGSKFSFMSTC